MSNIPFYRTQLEQATALQTVEAFAYSFSASWEAGVCGQEEGDQPYK